MSAKVYFFQDDAMFGRKKIYIIAQ